MNGRSPMVWPHFDIGGNRDLMIDSMHTENSANLHGRFAFWRHHPLDTVRPKSNFRIAFALQNLPMHLAISYAVFCLKKKKILTKIILDQIDIFQLMHALLFTVCILNTLN